MTPEERFQSSPLDILITLHEGNKLKPYLDCCGRPWRECLCIEKGKLTIGRGRNLDDVGISADESYFLFEHDKQRVIAQCRQQLPWFDGLDDVRKLVIIDMVFNLGIGGFLGFHATIAAIAAKQYGLAASQMLNSKWALQVEIGRAHV